MVHLSHIKKLNDKSHYKIVQFESIGESIGGMNIPIIKISNPKDNPARYKPVIMIIGR